MIGQERKTRKERVPEINRFEQFKPFVVYACVLVALNYAALTATERPTLSRIIPLLLVGLLTWGLIEYVVHRFVLHRELRKDGFNLPGTLTHLTHHKNPQALDRLNVPLSEGAPISVVYFALAWAATGGWLSAVYLYTGMMVGYFFYEWLDFQAHHGSPRTRLVRYFKKYHMQHHHCDARARYGVTSPLFDYLFGTFHQEKRRPTVREQRKLWSA